MSLQMMIAWNYDLLNLKMIELNEIYCETFLMHAPLIGDDDVKVKYSLINTLMMIK